MCAVSSEARNEPLCRMAANNVTDTDDRDVLRQDESSGRLFQRMISTEFSKTEDEWLTSLSHGRRRKGRQHRKDRREGDVRATGHNSGEADHGNLDFAHQSGVSSERALG